MKKFAHSFGGHIERYSYALPHVYRRSVLDIGSSDGFGSHLLSYCADNITLCDISAKRLDEAKRWHKFFAPAFFVQTDLEKDFPEGTWDVIVAFEVLEHLANPELAVENVAKHLKPNGTFIFSVPHMVENHEHKTLFDEAKIRALVSKYLVIKELFLQDKQAICGRPLYNNLTCHVGIATKE